MINLALGRRAGGELETNMKTKHVSPERKRKAIAYAALPLARVISPLRHVLAKHTHKTNFNGTVSRTFDDIAHRAIDAAKRGDGLTVQRIAMAL